MVSTRPLISKSSSPYTNPLLTVIIIIIIIILSFSLQPVVSRWSLSDSKSPQVSRLF